MASGYVPVLKSVSENEVYANFIAKADDVDAMIAEAFQDAIDECEYNG